MSRRGETITLSLDAADKAALEELALLYGCTWGDKPNISALLKAIAQNKLKIVYGDEEQLTPARVKQGKAAILKVTQGLQELAAILF